MEEEDLQIKSYKFLQLRVSRKIQVLGITYQRQDSFFWILSMFDFHSAIPTIFFVEGKILVSVVPGKEKQLEQIHRSVHVQKFRLDEPILQISFKWRCKKPSSCGHSFRFMGGYILKSIRKQFKEKQKQPLPQRSSRNSARCFTSFLSFFAQV